MEALFMKHFTAHQSGGPVMTFLQFQCFAAAVEADTFFDAADRLNITQSTLSKQIFKLEAELNVKLFDRSRRNAVLTTAGRYFYGYVKKELRQYDSMLSRMDQFSVKSENHLKIGTLPFLRQYHFAAPLKHFAEAHPEIAFSYEEAEEPALLRNLDSNLYQLILVRGNLVSENRFRICPILTDYLCAVVPAGHPLAMLPSCSIRALASERLILMSQYTAIYRFCIEQLRLAGIEPHIIRTEKVESILDSVAVGEGVSLLPAQNVRIFHDSNTFRLIPVNDIPPMQIVLAQKKTAEETAAVRKFIQFMKNAAAPVSRLHSVSPEAPADDLP